MTPEAPPRRFHIRVDRELTHPQVLSLLDEHLAGMRAASPPECVFALDLNGLRQPEITFLTAWRLPADASTDTSTSAATRASAWNPAARRRLMRRLRCTGVRVCGMWIVCGLPG